MKNRAFTLLEIMLVVVAVGILAGMLFPRYRGVLGGANDVVAGAAANTLNTAMFTYSKRIPNASANWTAAATDADKYLLLYNAGFLPGSAATLAGFTPSGYTISFPAVTSGRCTVTGPSGALSY
jgi:prepilin-type N-terminal cleavage/methylation domain-containing protein